MPGKCRKKSTFLPHWNEICVEDVPLAKWCRPNGEGKVFCSACGILIKYDNIGLRCLRDHAMSQRHKDNMHAVRQDAPSKVKPRKPAVKSSSDSLKQATKIMGKELQPLKIDVGSQGAKVMARNKHQTTPMKPVEAKPSIDHGPQNRFVSVFMCFYCCDEFSSRDLLQTHQSGCDMKPPELQAITPPGRAMQPAQSAGPPSPTLPPLLCHSSDLAPHTPAKQMKQLSPLPHMKLSKSGFIDSLGLIPKKKAAQVCNRRRNTECESIDLEEDLPLSPTPRTPKLLISHLSRDNSSSDANSAPSPFRRRMSLFSSPQHGQGEKSTSTISENQDTSEQCREGGEVVGEKPQKMTITKSLYTIDLTSPLGQLVSKHIKGDPSLHVLADVESHCLTASPKKNPSAVRLRERHTYYPITFRGFSLKKHIHQFNFTRAQRKDFLRRVNSGLDRESRNLLRRMKRCSVNLCSITKADLKRWLPSQNHITVGLQPLTADEIAYWTFPKSIPVSEAASVFPHGLTFSSPNVKHILGLRTRPDPPSLRPLLSLGTYVSEETLAEVMQHRRTVYQSLLSDSASSGESSEVENSPPPPSYSLLRQMLTTSSPSRPVNDITNLKVDLSSTTSKYGLLSPLATPPPISDQPSYKANHQAVEKGVDQSSPPGSSKSSQASSPIVLSAKHSEVVDPLAVNCSSGHSVCIKQMTDSGQVIKKTITSPLTKALASRALTKRKLSSDSSSCSLSLDSSHSVTIRSSRSVFSKNSSNGVTLRSKKLKDDSLKIPVKSVKICDTRVENVVMEQSEKLKDASLETSATMNSEKLCGSPVESSQPDKSSPKKSAVRVKPAVRHGVKRSLRSSTLLSSPCPKRTRQDLLASLVTSLERPSPTDNFTSNNETALLTNLGKLPSSQKVNGKAFDTEKAAQALQHVIRRISTDSINKDSQTSLVRQTQFPDQGKVNQLQTESKQGGNVRRESGSKSVSHATKRRMLAAGLVKRENSDSCVQSGDCFKGKHSSNHGGSVRLVESQSLPNLQHVMDPNTKCTNLGLQKGSPSNCLIHNSGRQKSPTINVRRRNSFTSKQMALRHKCFLQRSLSVSKQAEERKSLLTSFLG